MTTGHSHRRAPRGAQGLGTRRAKRLVNLLFYIMIGAAVPLLFPCSPARAELRLSISPMRIHLAMSPGSRQTKSIEVYNGGDVVVRVTTSVSSWMTTRDGGMVFSPGNRIERSADGWVHPDLHEFTLSPRKSRIVRLVTELPDSTDGSYWAIVFFEAEGPSSSRALGVTSKARIGSTIYVTASGTERRNDAITGMAVVPGPQSGLASLRVSLANRGNVYYYPAGWFQVFGADGSSLLEEKLPYRVLLPNTETSYQVNWILKTPGTHRLLATFDLGQETLMQGVLEFTVPDTFPAPPVVLPGSLPAAGLPVATGGSSP